MLDYLGKRRSIRCLGDSSNKAKTHFTRIRELTGIPYNRMLFFDDWWYVHADWGCATRYLSAFCFVYIAYKYGLWLCSLPATGEIIAEWSQLLAWKMDIASLLIGHHLVSGRRTGPSRDWKCTDRVTGKEH